MLEDALPRNRKFFRELGRRLGTIFGEIDQQIAPHRVCQRVENRRVGQYGMLLPSKWAFKFSIDIVYPLPVAFNHSCRSASDNAS